MKQYLAILRGINVGGQKSVKMDSLRLLLGQNGFQDVETYIQSGNVFFNYSETGHNELKLLIEETVYRHFGFFVPVIIRTKDEMKNIISKNPFLIKEHSDKSRLYLTFLDKVPEKKYSGLVKDLDFSPELFFLLEKNIYLFTPIGYGKTRLSNSFFEGKLKALMHLISVIVLVPTRIILIFDISIH